MNGLWQEELTNFLKMMRPQKIVWLSRLLFFVSMFARDTYQVGSIHVDNPEKLRMYNELLHRISSFQLEIASNEPVGMPDDQFFLMLSDAVDELNISASSLLGEIKKLR